MPKSKIWINWAANLQPNKILERCAPRVIYPKKKPGIKIPEAYRDAIILISK